jgi:hypothetical protein
MKRFLLIGATALALLVALAIPGLVFAHPAHTVKPAASPCTTLTGPVHQECLLWVVASPNAVDFPASGPLYVEVVLELPARCHIIIGIPDFLVTGEVDWGGNPITIATFSSGLRAEYHADNHVRVYNAQSQQLCP